ncbi:hypothetical protein IJ579_04685 [bacterium]|nr:hypothetical protein [bacterium]
MNDKCSKYETIFTFRSDEELKDHIKSCPDCEEIHSKMEKVSKLIQEVKPFYMKKQKNTLKFRAACVLLFLIVGGSTIGLISTNTDISDTIMYGTTLSAEDLGFPVDSYGLISVE